MNLNQLSKVTEFTVLDNGFYPATLTGFYNLGEIENVYMAKKTLSTRFFWQFTIIVPDTNEHLKIYVETGAGVGQNTKNKLNMVMQAVLTADDYQKFMQLALDKEIVELMGRQVGITIEKNVKEGKEYNNIQAITNMKFDDDTEWDFDFYPDPDDVLALAKEGKTHVFITRKLAYLINTSSEQLDDMFDPNKKTKHFIKKF